MLVIASPNAEVRARWRQALQSVPAIHEVATRTALERSLASLKPAILLLDRALPKLGGVAGVRLIQRFSPPTKIIVFSSTPNEQEGLSVLKAGARGYCRTEIDPALLEKAVAMVQTGEIWIGRNLIPHLLEELTSLTERGRTAPPGHRDLRLDRLTPREREIVQLIGRGASNKEIAGRLNVTERTIKAHLTAIFRKTGFRDRLRLALFVAEDMRASR